MAKAWVECLEEVRDPEGEDGEWRLCFQWAQYHFDDGHKQLGYRFIWRKPNGNLQAARGQARIPDAASMFRLIHAAVQEGWFIRIEATNI